jgi:hypothetical protein
LATAHVVGCGTIGSNLVLALCKIGGFDRLHIYDHDVVTYSEIPEFPFQEAVMGLPKVEALSVLIEGLQLNRNTALFCHEVQVKKSISDKGVVIDCRDRKDKAINADVRLSMDGPVLVVDSRAGLISVDDYNDYVIEKDPRYIELGIAVAANFICREMYTTKQYSVYDLRSILHSATIVNLEAHNEHGSATGQNSTENNN